MLRCTVRWIQLLQELAERIGQIAQHDPDLARQIRRASTSVALNLSEGNASTKGTRKARFENAYASLKETLTALEVATALGYIPPLTPEQLDTFDYVAACAYRLMNPR